MIGLMAPALSGARERARSAACLTRLHSLHVATLVYADAYHLQPVTPTVGVVQELDLPAATWVCPSDVAMGTWEHGSSYTYIAPFYMVDPPGSQFVLQSLKPWLAMRAYEQNDDLPLFWDMDTRHENDRNVVYWDGHTERRNW
jgi:prepilin-type processing-associated H-X9-DG protein